MKTKNNPVHPKSLVYIFTGDGKGKTSAALGVAMRAVGQGKRTAMVQWYKEKLKVKSEKLKVNTGTWLIGEHRLPELLKRPLFEIYPMGRGFYKLPTDHATLGEHKNAAMDAIGLAKTLLGGKTATMKPLFLLILDEALNAVSDKLISQISLIRLISQRGSTHIILTGRAAPPELIAAADLVVLNGLGLEERLAAAIDGVVGSGVTILEVAPAVDPLPWSADDSGGSLDPHVWLDPVRMADAAGLVASALAAIDPARGSSTAGGTEADRTRSIERLAWGVRVSRPASSNWVTW